MVFDIAMASKRAREILQLAARQAANETPSPGPTAARQAGPPPFQNNLGREQAADRPTGPRPLANNDEVPSASHNRLTARQVGALPITNDLGPEQAAVRPAGSRPLANNNAVPSTSRNLLGSDEIGYKDKVTDWLQTKQQEVSCRKKLHFRSPIKGKQKQLAKGLKTDKPKPRTHIPTARPEINLPEAVQNEKAISSHGSFTVKNGVSKTGRQDTSINKEECRQTPTKTFHVLSNIASPLLGGKDKAISLTLPSSSPTFTEKKKKDNLRARQDSPNVRTKSPRRSPLKFSCIASNTQKISMSDASPSTKKKESHTNNDIDSSPTKTISLTRQDKDEGLSLSDVSSKGITGNLLPTGKENTQKLLTRDDVEISQSRTPSKSRITIGKISTPQILLDCSGTPDRLVEKEKDLVTAEDSGITVLGLVTPAFSTLNNVSPLSHNNSTGFVDTFVVLNNEATPTGAEVLYQEPLVTDPLTPKTPDPIQRATSITSHASDQSLNHERGQIYHTPLQPKKRKRTPAERSDSPVRKRKRNPEMWKRNIRKTAANSGQEYISSRGKTIPAREVRSGCSCKFDCLHRIPEEERQDNFRTFWNLGDHERQWEFIRMHSKSKETNSVKGKRKCYRTFYLNDKKVCKKMFMTTLCIWDSWIDSAYSHLNSSKGKTSTPDKRGRHKHHAVVITPEKIKTVKDHVAEFPRVPSHYCRQRTKKEYLENGLTLQKMARNYVQWAQRKNLPVKSIASMRQYVDIINSNFNLGFFKPKKDQCKLCCLMRNKDNPPDIREKYKTLWISHIKNKDLLKRMKEKDKVAAEKDRSIALCSFDLQKQLNCPKSDASPFYYAPKLKVFNFTVFHSIKRKGFCYLWHEGIGHKGSNEVSSALLHFIADSVEKGYKEFIFYSDNCGGQNKNRFVFSMYEFAAVKYSIKITHRFLEPGHTMMEVDSIHARIEKSTDGKDIFDFKGWTDAIENAKEELPKYTVVPFKKNFVKTFKPLVEMQNWDKDMKGKLIKWSKIKEVHCNGSEGNLVRIKYEHGGENVTLSPNKPGRPVNLKTYIPPVAYATTIPLPASTIKSLQDLCSSLAIPADKHAFYDAVIAGCHAVEDDIATEPEYETDEEICVGEVLPQNTNKRVAEESEEAVDDLT